VRQVSRQKPAKASVVRQPKKVYGQMIGMGARNHATFVPHVDLFLVGSPRLFYCLSAYYVFFFPFRVHKYLLFGQKLKL
jgi:hypothetical protein